MDPYSSLPEDEEEEEEDYFETSEDIAFSSSDVESVGEGNLYSISQLSSSSSSSFSSSFSSSTSSFSSSSFSSTSSSPSSSLVSKYEIWKAIPATVEERRQRLHVRMGLNRNPYSSMGSEQMTNQPIFFKKEHESCGRDNPRTREQGQGYELPMVISRSDGRLEEISNNAILSDSQTIKSSTSSPSPSHCSQTWKPTRVAQKEKKLGRFSDSNNIHFDKNMTNFDSRKNSPVPERLSTDDENFQSRIVGAGATGTSTPTPTPNVDIFCRIKDLDSGKEFVVNELGKDGLWNRLKVLDTGKEISLEEFESCLGLSPIVQEVMRRQKAVDDDVHIYADAHDDEVEKKKKNKRGGWLRVIKWVVRGSLEKSHHQGSGSDERDTSTEKSRRTESITDDCQDPLRTGKPIKVHSNKKPVKEFGGLRVRQEIQAHDGAIWAMKFSHDGSFLASAGQDKVVRVWEVIEQNVESKDSPYTSGELNSNLEKIDISYQRHSELKSRLTMTYGTSHPHKLFRLSEIPKCNFHGHTEDILDLSWSQSQFLLSSSMDKTVRLWNVSSRGCLKVFKHNDYVTCIQFHPLDDSHFISGSLDGKVRIWRIKEPQVVDWVDLQEMVTAACYTPNGQGALVGSYKGTCRFYETSENKLQLDTTFEVRRNKGKRSQGKKITGFQFLPGDKRKVLITSSDSRIRVYDGTKIISKFKGFKNVKSQIAASFATNGQYIICGSEDSRVYIWKYTDSTLESAVRQKKLSYSYEHFTSRHVLVAIPWPGMMTNYQPMDLTSEDTKQAFTISSNVLDCDVPLINVASLYRHGKPSFDLKKSKKGVDIMSMNVSTSLMSDHEHAPRHPTTVTPPMLNPYLEDCCGSSMLASCISSSQNGSGKNVFFTDSKGPATWPEEKLPPLHQNSTKRTLGFPFSSLPHEETVHRNHAALGLVIVTASLEGDIRIFQNFGLPISS